MTTRFTLSLASPWSLMFQTMTPDEQRARVVQLHRHGWQEPALLTLTGWSRDFLLRVLADRAGGSLFANRKIRTPLLHACTDKTR